MFYSRGGLIDLVKRLPEACTPNIVGLIDASCSETLMALFEKNHEILGWNSLSFELGLESIRPYSAR
jgi:hypothetical protein